MGEGRFRRPRGQSCRYGGKFDYTRAQNGAGGRLNGKRAGKMPTDALNRAVGRFFTVGAVLVRVESK